MYSRRIVHARLSIRLKLQILDKRLSQPSPSYSMAPNPPQIMMTPMMVTRSGKWPSHTASTTATSPMVKRLATEDVVGPQTPISHIRPAF